jgi:hypothetical protein
MDTCKERRAVATSPALMAPRCYRARTVGLIQNRQNFVGREDAGERQERWRKDIGHGKRSLKNRCETPTARNRRIDVPAAKKGEEITHNDDRKYIQPRDRSRPPDAKSTKGDRLKELKGARRRSAAPRSDLAPTDGGCRRWTAEGSDAASRAFPR